MAEAKTVTETIIKVNIVLSNGEAQALRDLLASGVSAASLGEIGLHDLLSKLESVGFKHKSTYRQVAVQQ